MYLFCVRVPCIAIIYTNCCRMHAVYVYTSRSRRITNIDTISSYWIIRHTLNCAFIRHMRVYTAFDLYGWKSSDKQKNTRQRQRTSSNNAIQRTGFRIAQRPHNTKSSSERKRNSKRLAATGATVTWNAVEAELNDIASLYRKIKRAGSLTNSSITCFMVVTYRSKSNTVHIHFEWVKLFFFLFVSFFFFRFTSLVGRAFKPLNSNQEKTPKKYTKIQRIDLQCGTF